MRSDLAVLNSDAVNKYGYRFTLSALENAMWQRSMSGTPVNLGHDVHRPVGWMVPFAICCQPGLALLLGQYFQPETEEEGKQISAMREPYFLQLANEQKNRYEAEFVPHIKEYITEEHRFHDAGAFSVVDDLIVERVFPLLNQHRDKDGLIYINDLMKEFYYKSQGVFIHRTLPICIYAHHYFRRSLSRMNNFHFLFLDELMSYAGRDDMPIRIALDWHMIGYAPSFHEAQELEYWFGPKYSDDISAMPPGLTMLVSDNFERVYYGISKTEFFWKVTEETHEFELEELREDEVPVRPDHYSCRYVHSIFLDKQKRFDHFDGAIRSYEGEKYLERIGKKLTEAGRNSEYTKLFRIDKNIPLHVWKILTTNYLQGNPLIYEYFGEEKPKVTHKAEHAKSVGDKLLPCQMNKEDGLRFMLSYQQVEAVPEGSHVIKTPDKLSLSNKTHDFIEYDIVEIKKALERAGKTLSWPEKALLGYAHDEYWNIPCIFHGGNETAGDLQATIGALQQVVSRLVAQRKPRIISFAISWLMEDKHAVISIIGHTENLLHWLNQVTAIPVDRQGLLKWMEKQQQYLNAHYEGNSAGPLLGEIVKSDGIFYIKRVAVDSKYEVKWEPRDNQLYYSMTIPQNETDLYHMINDKNIVPCLCQTVTRVLCNVCGKDYATCQHSEILDDNTGTITEDFKIIGSFWTDKPIPVSFVNP